MLDFVGTDLTPIPYDSIPMSCVRDKIRDLYLVCKTIYQEIILVVIWSQCYDDCTVGLNIRLISSCDQQLSCGTARCSKSITRITSSAHKYYTYS